MLLAIRRARKSRHCSAPCVPSESLATLQRLVTAARAQQADKVVAEQKAKEARVAQAMAREAQAVAVLALGEKTVLGMVATAAQATAALVAAETAPAASVAEAADSQCEGPALSSQSKSLGPLAPQSMIAHR